MENIVLLLFGFISQTILAKSTEKLILLNPDLVLNQQASKNMATDVEDSE